MAVSPVPRMGLILPQQGARMPTLLETARAAEQAGLDVWVAGQLLPRPDSDQAKSVFEPIALLGAVAASVQGVRLGAMVFATPYLPAFYLAKAIVTLDHLSGGRLDVGLGAGWARSEFAALGVAMRDLAARIGQLAEAVDTLEQACAGEPVTTMAEAGETTTRCGPASLQSPHPPWWIGGSSRPVLRLVAERGDWANFARGISVADFAAAGAEVAELAGAARRRVRMSLTATVLTGSRAEVAQRIERRARERGVDPVQYRRRLRDQQVFVGDHEEVAEQMRSFTAAGCEAFVFWALDGDSPRTAQELAVVRQVLAA